VTTRPDAAGERRNGAARHVCTKVLRCPLRDTPLVSSPRGSSGQVSVAAACTPPLMHAEARGFSVFTFARTQACYVSYSKVLIGRDIPLYTETSGIVKRATDRVFEHC